MKEKQFYETSTLEGYFPLFNPFHKLYSNQSINLSKIEEKNVFHNSPPKFYSIYKGYSEGRQKFHKTNQLGSLEMLEIR